MCGICGILSLEPEVPNFRESLSRMCTALAHRGPDGEGQFVTGPVALGHRRLSIIDLAGGDQPIFNEDESVCVVFNGEIYNYLELFDELERLGHKFRTRSDTEVIVHAYEEYGLDCVKHFNGMFAFALWDRNRRRLVISRDRIGEKPLYYHLDSRRLIFASELKSLLTYPDIRPEVDPKAIEMYLTYGYIPEPFCVLKGFAKLPKAHTLVVENGRMKIHPYWQLDIPDAPTARTEADVLEEFEDLLTDAIKIRLRSDVPVGAFLSGGTDSNLIVAMAAAASPGNLSTFTVGFPDADISELEYARLTAERYQTNHHEIVLEALDHDLFPRIVRHFDEPFADSSAIPTYYVTREAARHVKVCISGDGGDELFCGYERYNLEPFERIGDLVPVALKKPLLEGLANLVPDSLPGKGWLRRQAVGGAQRWQRMMGPFDYFERRALYRPEFRDLVNDQALLFAPWFDRPGLEPVSRRMLADQMTYLPDDILVKVDRNSMWHGLEVRVPFIDHRIVEYANSLPLAMKKRGGESKYPIRKLLAPRVSPTLLARPKSGFGIPINQWLASSMKEFTNEMLLSTDTRIRNWFDQDALSQLIRANADGRRNLSKRIWTLLWLEQWCREFGV
ncbi:MAG: asparagine synthase (glutamine-hydrolyzing) [Pseudomonadota bacterium]